MSMTNGMLTVESATALWLKVKAGTATQAEQAAWARYKTAMWKASRS